MQTEIEAKFVNVDHDDIRSRLTDAGGVLEKPMRMMRRVVIDYPDRKMQIDGNAWVRIRDEGDKVTMTFKRTEENTFGGAEEIEVEVSDYQKTIDIFTAMGMIVHTEQETKRETWRLDETEVVLDEWPWLNPFIEIEGPSEISVKAAAMKLGFDWNHAVFGSVTTAYRLQYPAIELGEHVSMIEAIKFNMEKPEWFEKAAAKK